MGQDRRGQMLVDGARSEYLQRRMKANLLLPLNFVNGATEELEGETYMGGHEFPASKPVCDVKIFVSKPSITIIVGTTPYRL
jgi:hypothetical protein